MAQVLEDAADLYQSEKVHWCQGAYVKWGEDPVLTVCATTALGMAAGLGTWMPLAVDQADGTQRRNSRAVLMQHLVPYQQQRPEHTTWSRRAQALYLAAKKQVERRLKSQEFYHLPAFNDDDETTMDQVVDLFQSVAKELRNK
jgi:hypothetical protein